MLVYHVASCPSCGCDHGHVGTAASISATHQTHKYAIYNIYVSVDR